MKKLIIIRRSPDSAEFILTFSEVEESKITFLEIRLTEENFLADDLKFMKGFCGEQFGALK